MLGAKITPAGMWQPPSWIGAVSLRANSKITGRTRRASLHTASSQASSESTAACAVRSSSAGPR